MTKNNVILILIASALSGCQKNEIDKCVDALVVSECERFEKTSGCFNEVSRIYGGKFRLQCLAAQEGKH